MKLFFLSIMVAGLTLPVCAQTKTLRNLDDSGVNIQGCGGSHGNDVAHWLQAEKEVLAQGREKSGRASAGA